MKMVTILGIHIGYGKQYFLIGKNSYFKYSEHGLELSIGDYNEFSFLWNVGKSDPQGYFKNPLSLGSFVAGYIFGRFALTWEHHTREELEAIHKEVWSGHSCESCKGDTLVHF